MHIQRHSQLLRHRRERTTPRGPGAPPSRAAYLARQKRERKRRGTQRRGETRPRRSAFGSVYIDTAGGGESERARERKKKREKREKENDTRREKESLGVLTIFFIFPTSAFVCLGAVEDTTVYVYIARVSVNDSA